jgi:undecaprenyl-diphosphatase
LRPSGPGIAGWRTDLRNGPVRADGSGPRTRIQEGLMVDTRGSGEQPGARRHGRLSGWARPAGLLVAGGVAVWLVVSLFGGLITGTGPGRPVVSEDTRLSRWFDGERTPQLNILTHYGTLLSDTVTAVVVTIVVVALLLLRGQWQRAVIVVVSILGELFVFVLITATVHRPRPPVPHLDPAPPTSSFPSGHTAAAVALYVCFAVLLLRSGVSRAITVPLAVLFCLVPVVVGVSRMYRGMHYLSDVIFGALGGGCWLALTLYVLAGPPARALRALRARQ